MAQEDVKHVRTRGERVGGGRSLAAPEALGQRGGLRSSSKTNASQRPSCPYQISRVREVPPPHCNCEYFVGKVLPLRRVGRALYSRYLVNRDPGPSQERLRELFN
ncbi:hypothetical protein EVAR_3629_1 [Eumeta japonica]|uniref:Uncharacterized protein n=1 Tax=Eumeta variegata TaxID=151549 RepID=A0A4C1SWJ6_EUMVA|nr:hypothetical protein EVAR_3629_1 [Eumeta japonica]